jgi:hypothetical protein
MTQFERLIRPFQSPVVAPIIPPAFIPPTPPANVVITIGGAGDLTTFTGTFSKTTSKYMDATHRERGKSPSRKTHEKKVTNPDDSSQYVMVEVIDEISFLGPNGQFWTLKLDNP